MPSLGIIGHQSNGEVFTISAKRTSHSDSTKLQDSQDKRLASLWSSQPASVALNDFILLPPKLASLASTDSGFRAKEGPSRISF
jgi:hypothetical protein